MKVVHWMWCRLAVVILFFKLNFFSYCIQWSLGQRKSVILWKITQCLFKIWKQHIKYTICTSFLNCLLQSTLFFHSCCSLFCLLWCTIYFFNIEIDCIWEVVSIGFIFDHINNSSHSIMTPKYMDYVSCLFNNLSILTHCSYTYSNHFAQPEITLCPSYVRNKSRLLKLNC